MTQKIEPHQLLRVNNTFYVVSGVYLGAVGCTSLVGLKPISEKPGNTGGANVEEMLIPHSILDAVILNSETQLYKPVFDSDTQTP